jgi:hypothetical protein
LWSSYDRTWFPGPDKQEILILILIVLFCPGAPNPWLLLSYQWTILTVKTLKLFHLQPIIICQKLAVAKMLKQQKKNSIFNLSAFFNDLSHAPEMNVQHAKLLQSMPESAVCVCCNFSILHNYSLHCFGLRVDLQNLLKNWGVC